MVLKQKVRKYTFGQSVNEIKVMTRSPPARGEVYKLISAEGNFSSVHFIQFIANVEPIIRLAVSTLRVGRSQVECLSAMATAGRLHAADIYVSSLTGQGSTDQKYGYKKTLEIAATVHGWGVHVIKNHSKIILMRTAENHYVLETSSNLNDNPKIEHYSLSNDETLYEYYRGFFERIGGDTHGGTVSKI